MMKERLNALIKTVPLVGTSTEITTPTWVQDAFHFLKDLQLQQDLQDLQGLAAPEPPAYCLEDDVFKAEFAVRSCIHDAAQRHKSAITTDFHMARLKLLPSPVLGMQRPPAVVYKRAIGSTKFSR